VARRSGTLHAAVSTPTSTSREQHLNHGSNQQIIRSQATPVALQRGPGTGSRGSALWSRSSSCFSLLLVAGGIYGVRLSFALAKTFHTNPISAVVGALQGGRGSAIDHEKQTYQRINVVLYGYGGDQHSGAFLTDSIMVISISPCRVAHRRLPRSRSRATGS